IVVGKLDTKPYDGEDVRPNIANKTLFLGEVVEAYADEDYALGQAKDFLFLREGSFCNHYKLRQ
ncbi:hypothetical protein, partial [Candidatus Sordicultor fermentans]|uniref:hypothetical protein n=1 Tax=Candidatus Sordicultor fermentans TaxID=1953203 RepID=UPI0039088B5D